ncbi:hypothetical protein GBA52_009887 [Prunus armeniaca]|nr:hypothetical protein GBA52_009887 [Prunus armeniaca]
MQPCLLSRKPKQCQKLYRFTCRRGEVEPRKQAEERRKKEPSETVRLFECE